MGGAMRRLCVLSMLGAALLSSLFVGGCSMKKMVADNMMGSLRDITAAFYAESYVRHAREAGPSQLTLLDGFIKSSPNNDELLSAGAEMNCGFAFALLESEDKRWASRLYSKGRDYAIRALAERSDRIVPALSGPVEELEQVLVEEFDEDDAAALFWLGMCTGSWVNVNMGDMEAVAELPRVKAVIARVKELDETYFYGGPHLFFGVIAVTLPPLLGGDPVKGRESFDRVLEITEGRFLLAKVFSALSYVSDDPPRRDLFVETLQQVLREPDDIYPGGELLTAVAKLRAKELLGRTNELFLPPEGGEVPPLPSMGDDELDDLF